MLYSICIATYKRPELLKKLLESLSKQELPESVEIEVIIVDNDKSESAREVVVRAFKYGNHFARRQIEFNKSKLITRVRFLIVGISYFVICIVLSFVCIFNETKGLNWFLKLVSNWGKVAVTFGYHRVESNL